MTRAKRTIVVLLGAGLVLAFVLVGVIGLMAATQTGTRILLDQAQRLLPLEVNEVSGTLLSEIHIGRLRYRLPGQRLEIRQLKFTISPWPLLTNNRLQLDAVSANKFVWRNVGDPPADEAPAILELPVLPVDLVVERGQIDAVEFLEAPPFGLTFALGWNSDRLQITRLIATAEAFTVDLLGTLATGNDPELSATLSWSLPASGWSGQGTFDGPVDALVAHQAVNGDYRLLLDGSVNLHLPAEPAFDARFTMADFAVDDTALEGVAGTVAGTLDQLRIRAQGSARTPWIEPVALELQATGPPTGPMAVVLSANPLSGRMDAHGHIAWSEDLQIILNGVAQQLALKQIHPRLTGHIGGDVALAVSGGLLRVSATEVAGQVNDWPTVGALDLAQTPTGWALEHLDARIGGNTLTAMGTMAGKSIDVHTELNAPRLAELGLGVDGDLAAAINVSGSWPTLNGSATVTSGQLSGFDGQLQGLSMNAEVRDGRLNTTLAAEHGKFAGLDPAELSLSLGSLDAAFNEFTWAAGWTRGNARGRLRRTDEALMVRAEQAQVTLLERDWSLESPLEVRYASANIALDGFCVTGDRSRACVHEFRQDAQSLVTSGVLESLPIGLLAPWLPLRLHEDGQLQGSWNISRSNDQWLGNATLQALGLAVLLPDTEDTPIELPDASLTAQLIDDRLTVTGALDSDALEINGRADVSPPSLDGSVAGLITFNASDLSPLRAFDQRLLKADGKLAGQLAVAGLLRKPRAEGHIQVKDAALTLQNPDILLTDLELRVELDDTGNFQIRGQGRQPDASVQITGSGSNFFLPSRSLDANLLGATLYAEHPAWNVTVSPDLHLTYGNQRGHVSGSLTVPSAKIKLNTLPPSAPQVSADVVVIGRAETISEPVPVTVDVDLVLGDDIVLKAVGVTAELSGRLNARRDKRGRMSLNGSLDVAGGVLSAQGQSLNIESGVVMYDGPVDDPYLDLRAVRSIDNQTPSVKVGILIRGRADNLTSTIFSEPAMSDTRALSFLILGRDFDAASEGDGNQLASAAINLGLQTSKNIVADVRRFAGLDELSAMAESQNSFAIVAGKRIGPSLYVRYTYDTLAAVGALLVRYNLTKRWHLEAQSSENPAMDLFYSIEK